MDQEFKRDMKENEEHQERQRRQQLAKTLHQHKQDLDLLQMSTPLREELEYCKMNEEPELNQTRTQRNINNLAKFRQPVQVYHDFETGRQMVDKYPTTPEQIQRIEQREEVWFYNDQPWRRTERCMANPRCF